MGTCKTCVYWQAGECTFVYTIDSSKPEKRFEIEASADDDSNLSASLHTGPEFGCIHHLNK